MSRYVSDKLRHEVAQIAGFRCEYCRLPEIASFYSFQVDHIVALKHGGKTVINNLAYSCAVCNRNKGSDLGTILKPDGPIIPFFNPRVDRWNEHFELLNNCNLLGKTLIGEATIKIFNFNHPDSVIERSLLLTSGNYP
jgi:5-methylcytosine-specific restriction endonuclease McrA